MGRFVSLDSSCHFGDVYRTDYLCYRLLQSLHIMCRSGIFKTRTLSERLNGHEKTQKCPIPPSTWYDRVKKIDIPYLIRKCTGCELSVTRSYGVGDIPRLFRVDGRNQFSQKCFQPCYVCAISVHLFPFYRNSYFYHRSNVHRGNPFSILIIKPYAVSISWE